MKNTNNINLKILSKLFIVIIFAFIGYFSFPSDAYAVFPTVESITESVFTTNTTVHDVSMPASVSTGDILLALTNHDGNGTLTTPTGWTLLFSTVYNNTLKVGAYYKISDGSEGGTTVNFQTQYQEALVAQVYRLSNAEAVVSGTALGSYTNQPNPPSLTSGWGAVDTLWVAYAGAGNGIRTVNSYPTNYTNGITTNTGSNNTAQTMIASAVRQNNIATENPLNFTFNITDYTVANTIAIKPAPPKPAVTTNAATSITQTTATINATANPNGLSSTGWFRYYTSNPGSCSDSGGTRSPSSSGTDLGSGSTGVDYNRSLTGLTPGTAYYVCAFASNANGTSSGSVASFSTSAGTPTAVTATGESNLGSYYATLNGSANPNGYATTAHFRFFSADPGSCTDEGGTRFPELEGNDFSLGSGSSPVTFSADVSEVNMAPNQTYWYCAFAQNSYGEIASTKDSFTALDGPTDPCDAPVSGNHTVIGACSYEGLVGGVDGGTGTSNTATFTVSTGSTLTIDPGQGVAWGGISLQSGSSINLSAGGALRRAPIWVVDGDVDGFPASNTQSIGTSQPEGGVRRNTLSENYTYLSKIENASLDCNDANSNIFQTIESLVVDLDNDGYKTGATASTECVGSSTTISGRIYYDSGNGPAGFQNFEHTKEIVLNESLITGSTNLTNFPVLVTYTDADLRTTGNGGDVTNANGYDIVFTTTSDVKLDHEIESYDPVTGEIVMWVKIPTLSYNTDTNIYIYYGDDAISTSQENVAGVWSNGYQGVWHLGADLNDSTSNANNGTNVGAGLNVAGAIGDAISSDGTSGRVTVPNHTSLKPSNLTLSAWVYSNGNQDTWGKIIWFGQNAVSPYGPYGFQFNDTSNTLIGTQIATDSTNYQSYATGDSLAADAWTYLSQTYDGSDLDLYFNTNSYTTSPNAVIGDYDDTNGLGIGGRYDGATFQAFSGRVDEVRISNVARSADWLQAEYAVSNPVNQGIGNGKFVSAINLRNPYAYMDEGSALGSGVTDCYDNSGAPCPVSNFSLNGSDISHVDSSWTAEPGPTATSYKLEWCSGASCTPSTLITTGSTSYSHSGRTCGATYGYRVTASNAAGDSTASTTQYGAPVTCHDMRCDQAATPSSLGQSPAGTEVVRRVRLRNFGPGYADGVTLNFQMPASMQFDGWTSSNVSGCNNPIGEAGPLLTCDMGTMNSGASSTLVFDVTTLQAASGWGTGPVITTSTTETNATNDTCNSTPSSSLP